MYIWLSACLLSLYCYTMLYLFLLLVLYCSCRTLRTSPKSEPCAFGFPSVGSSAFASCSLEHLNHIVVFPYHSRVHHHHHLCCSRTFCFKSWEVSKFQFFRHIFMLTCLSDIRSLSVSTVHASLKFTLDLYLIPFPFLTTTHTKEEQLPCTADNIWNAATPACAEGQVQTGWLAVLGSYLLWEDHPIWRVQLWIRKPINQFASVSKWLGSWTNPPSDKIEISLTPDQ